MKSLAQKPARSEQSILFICKGSGDSAGVGGKISPAGLANSARLVVEMLRQAGVRADVVHVIDNNSIDRCVTLFRPDRVIIEALWVVPEKFTELKRLHPKVQWVVRLHSEIPFLAYEGIAIQWIREYIRIGVEVSANSRRAQEDLSVLGPITYTPNYYKPERAPARQLPERYITPWQALARGFEAHSGILNVGCFGALRPMKNQLLQALAAIRYADSVGRPLRFHINSITTGQDSQNVLKNLRALFAGDGPHKLVEHGWYGHSEFLKVLAGMDCGAQSSLSESYNISGADMVSVGLPVVFSHEVRWASWLSKVSATSGRSIFLGIRRALVGSRFWRIPEKLNWIRLYWNARMARRTWLRYLSE